MPLSRAIISRFAAGGWPWMEPGGRLMPAPLPIDSPTYATLTAMITPAIFMTANASLIISTSNRMARIVDRMRVLDDLGDKLSRGALDVDFRELRLDHVHEQLALLERRADRIRNALAALYLAFAHFVGTSLALAIDSVLFNWLIVLPTLLAVIGVGLLLGASVNLAREAKGALSSNASELRFYRSLHERRTKLDPPGPGPDAS